MRTNPPQEDARLEGLVPEPPTRDQRATLFGAGQRHKQAAHLIVCDLSIRQREVALVETDDEDVAKKPCYKVRPIKC